MAKRDSDKLQFDLPDVSELKERLRGVDSEFDQQIKALESKRRDARDVELMALKEQRGKLASNRNDIDIAINKLDKLIAELNDRSFTHAPSGGVTGKRMTKEEKEHLAEKALAHINSKSKDGASRREIAAHLALTPIQSQTVLKLLKIERKVRIVGAKSAARYYPA